MQVQSYNQSNWIELHHISKKYHFQPVIDDLNMTIEAGQICILVGANGAGKTTLLRIIAGLTRPNSGEILIGGSLIGTTPAIRNRIGYVGHQSMFYQDLSAEENLWHYARIYQVPQPENKVHHSLQAAGLFQHRSKPVRTFSHGMQQRLSLVRALIHEPNILLLDEPFTGLDQEAIQFLNEQITQLKKQGATVLLVMHQPHPMLGVATHIAWLKNGKVSHHIPLTRLNDAPDLQAYLQEPR